MSAAAETRSVADAEPTSRRAGGTIPLLESTLLLVSAVGIAYQIALMRVFSVGQWHHFAYMIISVAMLGFAASGTAIALLRPAIRGREATLFRLGAALLPLAIVGGYVGSQGVPFETFELVSQWRRQWWSLLRLYLLLAVPFFFVSWCITLGFLLRPRRVGRVYFVNLFGSGLGAAAVVALLYAFGPGTVAQALAIPAAIALPASLAGLSTRRAAVWLLALLPAVGLQAAVGLRPVRVSDYKGLAYAQRLPDARIDEVRVSPLSVLTAVRSSMLRETPGQISNYPLDELGPIPEQVGLYFDAGAVSPVVRLEDFPEDVAYLDYVTGALAYRLLERPEVLVIGAGGGSEVLGALAHGAGRVTAVEVDPNVFPLVRGRYADFSSGLYDRPDVIPVVAEGRGYLESRPEGEYDLIKLALLDSFNATAAGVHALSESYLYTREAVTTYIRRLSERGLLSVTRWISTPARDAIKMFATVAEAAERAGIGAPERHVAMIRSWNTATIVVSRSPLDPGQVEAIRDFADGRWFDVCYYPGMEAAEANRYVILDRPVYWEAASAILSPDRESFYGSYPFHVRPATDDRPFFSRFFRWRSLPAIRASGAAGWGGLVEWGYVALVATLVQAVILAVALVLLPLFLFSRGRRVRGEDGPAAEETGSGGRTPVLVYFGALGLAFMFLEIAFIQRLMLFLDYPIYAVAVVLTGFLVFSGFGSFFADRHRRSEARRGGAEGRRRGGVRLIGGAATAIAALALLYQLALGPLFETGAGWPEGVRVGASLALLAPLAFAMGIPFPTGLQAVSDLRAALVPWAWGWNGATSVVGATLAALTAVHFGFTVVVSSAVVFYVIAALGAPALFTEGTESTEPEPERAG